MSNHPDPIFVAPELYIPDMEMEVHHDTIQISQPRRVLFLKICYCLLFSASVVHVVIFMRYGRVGPIPRSGFQDLWSSSLHSNGPLVNHTPKTKLRIPLPSWTFISQDTRHFFAQLLSLAVHRKLHNR